MSLRILLVSDHYPPYIGGAHRQTQLLGQELHRRGHVVSVVTVWQPGQPSEYDDNGVRVYRLRELRTVFPWLIKDLKQRHHPPYPDPITVWRLRRLITEFKPDVIHAYGWMSYSCAAALIGKQIPLLISSRDYAYGCATRTLVFRKKQLCSGPQPIKCLICAADYYGKPRGWAVAIGTFAFGPLLRRKVQGVHSISSYVQQMVRRDFIPLHTNDLSVAPVTEAIIPSFREDDNRQDLGDRVDVQPYLQQLPQEPFILFVGALRLVKGLQQLLEAYQRLDSPPRLVLIGTVENDTPRTLPANVLILQDFPHPAVMAAWERCLFGVVPSLWPEPLGSVVYEGMSKGKAMIGTKPGGHTDMIIDGETGFLVPLGSVDELAQAMRTLISNPALCERFGRSALESARQFTASNAIPQFERLYHQLLSKTRKKVKANNSVSLS